MLLNRGVPPKAVIDGLDDLVIRHGEHQVWLGRSRIAPARAELLPPGRGAVERYLASWFEDDHGVTAGLYWAALPDDPRDDARYASPFAAGRRRGGPAGQGAQPVARQGSGVPSRQGPAWRSGCPGHQRADALPADRSSRAGRGPWGHRAGTDH